MECSTEQHTVRGLGLIYHKLRMFGFELLQFIQQSLSGSHRVLNRVVLAIVQVPAIGRNLVQG